MTTIALIDNRAKRLKLSSRGPATRLDHITGEVRKSDAPQT